MAKEYKLVIVGSGTAAMVAAMRVRAAGWTAAVIDFRPFGGTCALRGCDPKKVLIGVAGALDHARRNDRPRAGRPPRGPACGRDRQYLRARHGLTAAQLETTMFAYPTGASDIAHMV